jgi:hypothetical protein
MASEMADRATFPGNPDYGPAVESSRGLLRRLCRLMIARMSERQRKKKDGQDAGKKRQRMRESVGARKRPRRKRSATDETDTVTYKRGSAADRTRRGAT